MIKLKKLIIGNWPILFLTAITVIAFGLRISGINYHMYRDETYWLYAALKIGNLDFNYNFSGIYIPIMFFLYAFYFVIGFLLGIFGSTSDFLQAYFSNPHNYFLVGRIYECIAGAACIPVTYLISVKLFNRRIGLIAALLLSFSYVQVCICQRARGEAFSCLFLLLAFYYICKIIKKADLRNYILAGIFSGMAISIRMNMFPIILTLILVHLNCAAKNISFWRKIVRPKFLLALLFIPVLFLLSNPDINGQIQLVRVIMKTFINPTSGYMGSQPAQSAYLYYLQSGFLNAFGWTLFLLSVAGIIYAIVKIKDRHNLMILSFVVPYFAVIGKSSIASYQYLFPLAPFLAILSGQIIFKVVRLTAPDKWRDIFIALISLVIISEGTFLIIDKNRIQTLPRTQNISKEWVFANIPTDSRIAVDSMGENGPDLKNVPVIDNWIYNLSPKELQILYDEREKNNFRGGYALKYFMENPPYPKYYLKNLGTREMVSIEELKELKIEYIIVSSTVQNLYESKQIRQNFPVFASARLALYNWLDKDWELIKIFDSQPDLSIGPTIKIFSKEKAL